MSSPPSSPPMSPTIKTPPPTRCPPRNSFSPDPQSPTLSFHTSPHTSTYTSTYTPPSSPHSQTTSSPPPAIWAEFIAITVHAFTPEIISRLRDFVSSTPAFRPEDHLPLLASLITKHVAMCLEEPSQFRRSAYLAVKSKKILPFQFTEPIGTRRLSITRNFNRKSHSDFTRKPQPVEHNFPSRTPLSERNANVEPPAKPRYTHSSVPHINQPPPQKEPVLPSPQRSRMHRNLQATRVRRMHPRAGLESRIAQPSRRNARIVQRERESEKERPVSRLVHLRRKRLERKKAQAPT